ncbi:MAG: hypothetical protein LBR56_05160 [Sporomusaceae bacterium]|jgi:hypothetical protein|nr:hypothetical protein [Sporomusaceae bacterium]
MFYDPQELVAHYKEWYEKYRGAIEERLQDAASSGQPADAAAKVILEDVLPIALTEMILYNNKKLEERFNTEMEGGCASCASNFQ